MRKSKADLDPLLLRRLEMSKWRVALESLSVLIARLPVYEKQGCLAQSNAVLGLLVACLFCACFGVEAAAKLGGGGAIPGKRVRNYESTEID